MHKNVAALLVISLLAGCEASRPPTSASDETVFFQRFIAEDRQVLENDIRTARADLQAARAKGDQAAALGSPPISAAC